MKPLAQNTLIQNRYLVVQLIGKGGMGEVYLAVDQRLGSAVALKRTFFAGDEMLGTAFEREARVLARLRHPVLPKVSDHFGEGDEQYLVMEHISGDDLAKRIEVNQKPFPLSWVMFWADQLLDALSYLHSHEPVIIHRDIKPQNLKLTDENHIVLLDFGLSKSSTGQTNLASNTGSTGSVVGYTPHYAPMEQIRGIGTSPKSDLYSLSATLYQLMTNAVPADALTRADSMLNGMPDPIKAPTLLNAEVPPGVSEVLLRGMEVSQDKRFGTAREMQKALRKAFSEMQNAMSAQTIAFSTADVQTNGVSPVGEPNFDATEVMDPDALRAISNPVGAAQTASGFSESISQPRTAPPVDLNATVAFDSGMTGGDSLRQADVKTEVFIAGNSTPFGSDAHAEFAPTPTPENYEPAADYSSYAKTNDDFQVPATNGDSFSPDATTPFIAFDANGGTPGDPQSYSEAAAQPIGYETVVNHPEPARAYDSHAVPAAIPATAAPVKKKGSGGKIAAILGGLFIFFVAVLAVGGGGWYYYNNYYAVAPQASPSPAPTIEPTPVPTATVEAPVFVDDTNTNSSNTNSNVELTVDPTPAPTERPPDNDSTDRPDTRPTPAGTRPTPRPQPSKTPKPQPTKKPGTGPDILQ